MPNLAGFFGYKNPASKAENIIKQIPEATAQYQQPFFDVGVQQLPKLNETFGQMAQGPAEYHNQMMSKFQLPPWFEQMLQPELQGADASTAAQGLTGTPSQHYNRFNVENRFKNDAYNNWMDHVYGIQNTGLQGQQNLANQGFAAGNNLADTKAQAMAQQAQLRYAGGQNRNAANSQVLNMIGNILGAGYGMKPSGSSDFAKSAGFFGGLL